ncbi:hypothetical protein scyTo_0002133 [Scyliorhinus torazame]|uniref:NTR domain-containing protein n=1 Tax=Scyliorhinus torazame TaxID=75743 RepID=A0A401PHS9_SCYTO|nr:hypothetical protein [Scyliorhinus torazame]
MLRLCPWRWYCWKSWLLAGLVLGFAALCSAQVVHQKPRRPQWANRARQRRQVWSNEWSPWGSWSACSSTCGGGASFRSRRCSRFLNTDGCQGDQRQYRVCNLVDCPPGSIDFRKMQCSLYNNKPIQGNLMNHQWLPFYGAPNQCDLNCLAKGKNFYYMFGRVLDGTKCRPDSPDICINGQCLKVACDRILGSKATTDVCGVCGGRNDSCVLVRRVYRSALPSTGYFGYNNVTVIPAGATNIKVTDNSRNYLALISGKNHYVINGNWVIDWPGEFDVAGTKVLYKRSAGNHETIEAAGPTAEDLRVMSTILQAGYCRKCKKSKGKSQRIKQYCQKDFVFRGRILRKTIVGSETRYDVQVRQTYKNKYPIVHREYIWVPNTCDCPYLLEKREYIMMARRHVNFEQTLNRILLEHNSFVKLWQPKEDLMLRDINKYCHRYS